MTIRSGAQTFRDRRVLNPSKWGRLYWDYLFQLARLRPVERVGMNATRRHLREFGFLIPCRECRVFYRCFLQKTPVTSKTDLFQWVYRMKAAVNRKLRKPNISLSAAKKEQDLVDAAQAVARYIRYVRLSLPRPRAWYPHSELSKSSGKTFGAVLKLVRSHFLFLRELTPRISWMFDAVQAPNTQI